MTLADLLEVVMSHRRAPRTKLVVCAGQDVVSMLKRRCAELRTGASAGVDPTTALQECLVVQRVVHARGY